MMKLQSLKMTAYLSFLGPAHMYIHTHLGMCLSVLCVHLCIRVCVRSTNRSSVHSRSLPCGVCVGNVRRSLLLRWCCGVFSGDSCCRSDSSSRSYIILCSSRAVRFSSRYCFSRTWTTFCMGSTYTHTHAQNNKFYNPYI